MTDPPDSMRGWAASELHLLALMCREEERLLSAPLHPGDAERFAEMHRALRAAVTALPMRGVSAHTLF